MNPNFAAIYSNAIRYFQKEIRYWVALAKENNLPSEVRNARLRRARKVAAECREFRYRAS